MKELVVWVVLSSQMLNNLIIKILRIGIPVTTNYIHRFFKKMVIFIKLSSKGQLQKYKPENIEY